MPAVGEILVKGLNVFLHGFVFRQGVNKRDRLTPEIKAKVFGLNAARVYGIDPEAKRCAIQRDAIEQYRGVYRDIEPDTHEPRWAARGPISRRDMLRWFADHGGRWSPWR